MGHNRTLLSLLSTVLALALSATLAACGQKATNPTDGATTTTLAQGSSPEEGKITFSLVVDATEAEAGVLFDEPVTAEEGTTVYQALVDTELPLQVDTSAGGVFVQGIGDVVAQDGKAGWLLTVNGELSAVGADQAKIADGDVIEWKYYADAASAL